MALKERPTRPGRGIPGSSLAAAWPLAVSVLGGWLKQQSRRRGPLGGAAGVAVVVVNRSASLLTEVSSEVARATAREDGGAKAATGPKRGTSSRKARLKSSAARRARPAG